jgi:hypothetical protein
MLTMLERMRGKWEAAKIGGHHAAVAIANARA